MRALGVVVFVSCASFACGDLVGVDGDYELGRVTSGSSTGGGNAPSGWKCPAAVYNSGAECDCNCGIPDPDCDDSEDPDVTGNFPFTCDSSGNCGEADFSTCHTCSKGKCQSGS